MEPKSPNYEKLVASDKAPQSPVLRPFRLKFRKMLSAGNLKGYSVPSSPVVEKDNKEEFHFHSEESLARPESSCSGYSSRPSSFSSADRSPMDKKSFEGKIRSVPYSIVFFFTLSIVLFEKLLKIWFYLLK